MLTPAQMSEKQMLLESFFEKGGRPSDETAEDSKTANIKKAALKTPRVLLKLQVHCNRWFLFSRPTLYSTWWPAIQRSHGAFKTASPHGDQAPCIKRQGFGVFQKKKNVNTKNRSNYWRPPLHQMCLSDWEHHSWWLTALLKLRSPLLLVNSWSCLLIRTFVTNFQERLQFKRWYMAPAKMEAYVDMLCFLTQLKEGQQPI